MYLVAVCDACVGGAEAEVLDNIVHYPSSDFSTLLTAKYNNRRYDHLRKWRIWQTLLKKLRSTTNWESTRPRSRCGSRRQRHAEGDSLVLHLRQKGHLKIDCKSKKKTKEWHHEISSEDEFILMVQEGNGDARNDWILDSGASRHLFNDERLLLHARNAVMRCPSPTTRRSC